METIAYRDQTLSRWRVGKSTFLAMPERGARLMNWNLALADGSVRDVIYWPEDADFGNFAKVRGGNPVLFPFSGRTFDAGEQNTWRTPDGVRRPMPQHGIARQGRFKVLWQDERGFAAQLLADEEARAAYPYEYEFTVIYRFEAVGLSCEMTLKNLDRTPIAWSPGHHFYFTLPWTEGTVRSDYAIRIPASERWRQDTTGALVPGPAIKELDSFANPALVETIHTGLRRNEVVFGERGRPGDVVIRVGTSKVPSPDTAILTWTPSETAPFYCVEPWMGAPNAPEHRRGLQLVAPGEKATFVVGVLVK